MKSKTRVRAGRFTHNRHETLVRDKRWKHSSRPLGSVPQPKVSSESSWCPGGELVPDHLPGLDDLSNIKHSSERHERRHAMQTRRFTQLLGLALAILVGSAGAEDSKLKGTWNVAVQFGRCDDACPCPPGVDTETKDPGLHMYLRDSPSTQRGGVLSR
jgi:hypothetical protein